MLCNDSRELSKKKYLCKFNSTMKKEELFTSPQLDYVCININNICNARCTFCDIWKEKRDHHPDINWNNILDELIFLGVKEVNIHGGEAFLSKTFFPLLEYGAKKTAFSIITNGILLDKFYDQLFSANIKRLYISIDHHDVKLHAKSRGIPQLEKKLYPILKKIRNEQSHLEMIVNHVVSSYNIESIETMLLLMKEIGFDAINLIPIKDMPSLYVTKFQIKTFYEKVESLLLKELISLNDFFNGFYKIFGEEHDWDCAEKGIYNRALKKDCIIPALMMFIEGTDGSVYPCDTTKYRENPEQYVMGNILYSSVKDIWFGEKYRIFREKMYPNVTCKCVNSCDPANRLIS